MGDEQEKDLAEAIENAGGEVRSALESQEGATAADALFAIAEAINRLTAAVEKLPKV